MEATSGKEGVFMDKFPDITRWFNICNYTEFNSCRKIEINMKKLTSTEINDFCNEFALFICRLRCPSEDLLLKMENAIKGVAGLKINDKKILRAIFHTGFISDTKYKRTKDYWQSFDDDGIKGYFGECFYYVLRKQILEDEKVYIEPKVPKNSSKIPGIDFVDIRKDKDGYYMIIGEVKTTGNKYSSRIPEILDSFTNRIDKTFSEVYLQIKENDDGSNAEYSAFLQEMLGIFYRITGDVGKKKRVSGTINYNYEGKGIDKRAFSSVKDKLQDIVSDESMCRRFKLIGIYDIENVIEQTRNIIWSVL